MINAIRNPAVTPIWLDHILAIEPIRFTNRRFNHFNKFSVTPTRGGAQSHMSMGVYTDRRRTCYGHRSDICLRPPPPASVAGHVNTSQAMLDCVFDDAGSQNLTVSTSNKGNRNSVGPVIHRPEPQSPGMFFCQVIQVESSEANSEDK